MKDLLSFKEWSPAKLQALLAFAIQLKQHPEKFGKPLADKSIVALFEKPSLRTRVSFDIGIHKLGGHMVYVDSRGQPLEKREDPIDIGANLACWADAIVARVFNHSTLEKLSEGASIPVVNALCDLYHPCQALADYLSLAEQYEGDIKGKTLAYVGDGNNVTHSLLIVGALLGCHQVVVTPKGYEIDPNIVKLVSKLATTTGISIVYSNDVADIKNVDVIYTDTWLSMGDDTPFAEIKSIFKPYQVNEKLMQSSGASYVMHCQPAHRDVEITGSLMDSKSSLLMQQAENRMHAQNAILSVLVGNIDLSQF